MRLEERFRTLFGLFSRKQNSKLPAYIGEGIVDLSVSQIMQERINAMEGSRSVRKAWIANHFYSTDGIVYHPEGRFLLVLDFFRRFPNLVSREDFLQGTGREKPGYLHKKEEDALMAYEILKQERGVAEFGADAFRPDEESFFTREQILGNPLWRFLARDDALLKSYVDSYFKEISWVKDTYDSLAREALCDGKAALFTFPRYIREGLPEVWSLFFTGFGDCSSLCCGGQAVINVRELNEASAKRAGLSVEKYLKREFAKLPSGGEKLPIADTRSIELSSGVWVIPGSIIKPITIEAPVYSSN